MNRALLLTLCLAAVPAVALGAPATPPPEFYQVVAARAFEHPNPAVVEAVRVLKQTNFLAAIYGAALAQGVTNPPGRFDVEKVKAAVATWRSQTELEFNSTTYSVNPCISRPAGELRIIEARPTIDPERVGSGSLDVHVVIPFRERCESGFEGSPTDYFFWLQLDPQTGFLTRSERTGFDAKDPPPWRPRE